jgi:hypothetical protein
MKHARKRAPSSLMAVRSTVIIEGCTRPWSSQSAEPCSRLVRSTPQGAVRNLQSAPTMSRPISTPRSRTTLTSRSDEITRGDD